MQHTCGGGGGDLQKVNILSKLYKSRELACHKKMLRHKIRAALHLQYFSFLREVQRGINE